jgi:hypothetical protein
LTLKHLGVIPDNIKNYKSLFKDHSTEKVILEATPSYFYGGIKLIHQLEADLGSEFKSLVILRNPTDRFVSYFRFIKSRFLIDKEETFSLFVEKCKLEDDLSLQMEIGHYKNAFKEGLYTQFIDPWLDELGTERFKVVFFDDLLYSPEDVVNGLCKWLDLEPSFYENYQFGIQNQTVMPGKKWFHQLAVRTNKGLDSFLRSNKAIKAVIKKVYYQVNGKANRQGDEISKGELEQIAKFFEPYNKELKGKLIKHYPDMKLPVWLK